MNPLSKIVLTITVLTIVRALLLALSPDRWRRDIKTVISVICVIILAGVLTHTDFSTLDSAFSDVEMPSPRFERDALIQSELEKKLSDYVTALLDEKGISTQKVEIKTTISPERSISITEAILTMNETEALRLEEAVSLIKEKVGDIEVQVITESENRD